MLYLSDLHFKRIPTRKVGNDLLVLVSGNLHERLNLC